MEVTAATFRRTSESRQVHSSRGARPFGRPLRALDRDARRFCGGMGKEVVVDPPRWRKSWYVQGLGMPRID